MKRQTSFNVEILATIIVSNKPMQISRRITKNGVKVYLHFPLRHVTPVNEISKDLALQLLQISK